MEKKPSRERLSDRAKNGGGCHNQNIAEITGIEGNFDA